MTTHTSGLKPFASVTEASEFWKSVERPCSILIDFSSIGVGLQRRTFHRAGGRWVLGFADPIDARQVAAAKADIEAADRYRKLAERNPSLRRDYSSRANRAEEIGRAQLPQGVA
jgi:hypothetical protein